MASASKASNSDKRSKCCQALEYLQKAGEGFKKINAFHRVKEVYYTMVTRNITKNCFV